MIVKEKFVIVGVRVDINIFHIGIEAGLGQQNFDELFDMLACRVDVAVARLLLGIVAELNASALVAPLYRIVRTCPIGE